MYLRICIILFLLSVFSMQESCAQQLELIENGEFQNPVVSPLSFDNIPNSLIPGWSNSSGQVEVWGVGFGGPVFGSDNNPAGQHIELSTSSAGEITTQIVSIPMNVNGTAEFSFDGWARFGTQQINIELTGDSSGVVLSDTFLVDNQSWQHYSNSIGGLVQGETVEVRFSYLGGDGGPHIDQVSLLTDVEECTFVSNNFLCDLDGDGQPTGDFVITGEFTNLQDIPGTHLFLFPNATPQGVEVCFGNGQQGMQIDPPLNNGDSYEVGSDLSNSNAIIVKNAMPGDEVCFTMTLLGENGVECCTLEACFVMPPCDCLQVDRRFDEISDVVCNADGTVDFSYSFQLTNLFGMDVYHSFLGSLGEELFLPDFFDLLAANGNMPLLQGQSVQLKTVVTGAMPGDLVDFLITIHNEDLSECCTRPHDVVAPVCDFEEPDEIKGDVNCDGVVNLLDVGPFVDVITGGGPYNVKADVNCDGVNDLLDVQPFVALLV